ncbi:hypothetical protein ACLMJK_003958 [Lecanora helva]
MLKTFPPQSSSTPQTAESIVEHPYPDPSTSTNDPDQPNDPNPSPSPNDPNPPASSEYLIVSPYTTHPHLLNLTTLSTPASLLAQSLTHLSSTRTDYATAPYHTSFNWPTVITHLKTLSHQTPNHQWQHQNFYIIVFRSRIPPTTDRIELGELDQRAHAEAMRSGGLLKYWFGVPDGEGRNLATCIWRHHSDARPASQGPGHKTAARKTISMYNEWRIERLKLEIGHGVESWRIGEWED